MNVIRDRRPFSGASTIASSVGEATSTASIVNGPVSSQFRFQAARPASSPSHHGDRGHSRS
jgi:hypothetical protein